MDTRKLALFAEVARVGSFAAAAQRRDIDPSAVSRTIAQLESELGVRLFQRTTRRLALTEAGSALFERAGPLVDELHGVLDATREGRGAVEGTLRLTASVSFGQCVIGPLLGGLRALYPDLRLECLFTDANLDLVAERIDLAVRLAPSLDGDLVAVKLVDTRYRVVASRTYVEATTPIETPGNLSMHPCVVFPLRDFKTRWRFRDSVGSETTVPIDGAVTLSPAIAVRDAALRGMGPALLPDWLIRRDLDDGGLIDLFPDYEVGATSFATAAWLVYANRVYVPAKVRAAIDYFRAHAGRGSDGTPGWQRGREVSEYP